MTIERFFDRVQGSRSSLVVVNREQPQPVQRMLSRLFEDQPVTVEETEIPDGERDLVLLVRDGVVVASSTLEDVMNAILMVNSDLFVTGSRDLVDADLPDVLAEIEETRFDVRGYPASENDKLLLIAVSRAIEREAFLADAGRLRSAFQYLSRIRDESGTRAVYDTLGDSDLDVHVYGIPDWVPPEALGVTIHGGYGHDFRRGWFVVHHRPDGGGTALVAARTDEQRWSGFWTSRDPLVDDVADYIARNL
ncbi:histidine kinase [Halarchaeum salinum]|uniref:DICT sensory domain-containing protein n=1 Tax=Halarchaeum salinum TaxID=489912 RepID=A0AAV3S5G8_9EURY